MRWRCPTDLAVGGRSFRVRFGDWLGPLGGGLLMNRSWI
jgi:hypothetical protein